MKSLIHDFGGAPTGIAAVRWYDRAVTDSPVRRPLPDTRNAGAAYWKAAAAGDLALPQCQQCNRAFWYPRPLCPRCGSDRIAWIKARGSGRIHTFTVVRQSPDPFFRTRVPFVVAVVELDEGPLILSNLVGCDIASVAIGMPVAAQFEAAQEGLAIPLFRPVAAGRAA